MMMNFLDLSAASEEECRLIKEILSDTSVVNIADPIESKLISSSATTPSNSASASQAPKHDSTQVRPNLSQPQPSHDQHQPTYAIQQHGSHAINGHKQSFRTNTIVSNTGPSSFSNTSNHGHMNNIVPVTATQNYRNNYNGQRKNVHNSGNISSISNTNRNRIPSSSNVPSVNNNVHQPIYPQQFTPPLPPSNAGPSVQYHSINVNNMNGHNPNAISNQLNYRHPRASDHGSDRHGGMGNHIHGNNNINLVSTSSSAMPNMNPNIGQHHSNAMPLNMYNQHATHMHHQVPAAMSGAKIDQKNVGNKNSAYHVQETSDSLQTASPGGQSSSPSGQIPQMAGDMNTVIGMDMTNAHPPQGYAIQAFAPPHPHQMFSGPPIFQPHPYSYLIPYNLPPYVPYVPMPSNTVPPRHQVQPQTSQNSGTGHTSAHSRQSHTINQQTDHYEANSSNNHTNDQHHSPPDDSQSAEGTGMQSQSTGKSDVNLADGHKISQGTITTSASQMSSSGSYSTGNPAPGSHTLAGTHPEKPINATHINRDTSSRKVSPPAGKLRGPVPTIESDKAELSAPKSSPETHASSANGKPLSEGIQKDSRDMNSIPTLSAIDDQKPPKPSIDASIHDQSSLGVTQVHQESSNKSTNNLNKNPQSAGEARNKSPTEDISQNSVDVKDIDANQRSGGAWAPNSSKSWADLFKRQESHATRSTEGDSENCAQWTENSDEEGKTHKLSRKSESAMKSTSGASTKEQRSQELAKRAQDKMAHRVAMKVNSINLKHALPFLKPRGFINKGNGCYINATLQALIACPPFYNLMKEIGDLRAFRRENSCTPILDSFAELFLHFPPLDSGKKIKQTGSAEQKLSINSLQAEAIEPKCIYNVLGNIKSECLRGAQEDAEEFLSSVLNGLHEEMISLGEILHESNGQNNQQSDVEDSNDDNTNDDNLWREVGSKNRSLPIRIAKVVNTPIQEIFGGSLFSIRTAGRDRCGHRSPFFDLQLDISGDNVKSVQDAIKSFTSPEIIHDFYCSKTRQKLDAQRRTSLDQLPPILILHLKQFVYTQDYGLKKLMKKIEYPIDFELPESCLHEKNSADKNLLTSRSYKLLAVVYHDGKEAVKGHYLTDVYHIGSSQWIRCDDSNLKVISSPRIENTDAPRTPYLLFYRRLNTLRAQSNNNNNSNSNNHDNKKKT